MRIMAYSEARSSLKSVLDTVNDDADFDVIACRGHYDD